MPAITKIAVTGGPCAGKTTALVSINAAFSRLGYKVITVPEPATEFISNGVTPWECCTTEEYQWCQMKVQVTRERAFERAARGMNEDKILIVCDRGMLDNRCYMTEEEFQRVIADLGYTEAELCDSYDAVFHLVSAAKGAEEFFGDETNAARYESLEEAAELDDHFIESWTGHPYLRVIGNETDFEEKIKRLISEISYFMGELVPYEIERKFLIAYPDIAWLEAEPACERVEIVQHYLHSDEGHEVRLRQRKLHGHHAYSLIEKKVEGSKKSLVRRQHLTSREYQNLLTQVDPNHRELRKTRYCLTYQGQYFEIDLYPFWDDRAVVQIELSSEDAPIAFPPQMEVLCEVTNDPAYHNAEIAHKLCEFEA